ncbi:MAG: SIS domain-containing protein, partial [Halothiobacillaceae bacterium]
MSLAASHVHSHLEAVRALHAQLDVIEGIGALAVGSLRHGARILICGNGGSAADAQHIAAELVGRFAHRRRGLPAIALTTDTSALTS